uniref:F5/8 type C domain-containing protein n=1 Tax=Clytia hemisphaerica TaxID=252671 RepID=A0A7M5WZ86_9CNID
TGPTTTTTNFTHHTSTHKQRHDHSLHVNPKIPHKSAPVCEEKCNFLGKCDTVFTAGTNSFCRPGCTCPNGTVWSGKTCVQPLACPCKDDQGTIHDPDSIWTDPNNKCSECRCLNNRIQCKPKQCPILPCPTAEQRLYDGDCCTSCEEITTAPPSITTTKESTTEASTTQSQTTEASTTESQTTTEEALTTPSQSTESQTTQPQTTAESSTTPSQSTESPTTPSQTTESPTTQSQTTAESSTTPSQSTESPTTPSQTTESPTTPSQTTKASTTQSQSTIEASTTESQTTEQSTTVSPTKAPICDCKNPLPVGVSNKMIPDSQMKTNSIRSPEPGPANTGPAQARLNNRQSFKGSGAWEPKDKEAHLDIIFNKMEDVREIRTQGSPRDERFARRYFVFYSLDGENFENEPLQSPEGSYIFEGNNDNNGIKVNKLNIKAKAIRIVPANDESIGEPQVAMRVELYVCPPCSTTPAPPVTTTQSTTTVRISTNIYTEPPLTTEPQVKETTTEQSTTESSTTESQTTESSTTESPTTKSSTTQSQTTPEASTIPSQSTTEASTTEAATTQSQTTPETSTTQSTIPTTVTTPIVTTSPQCPSMQVYSTNCTSEYHCDSREMCQPVQYAGCCCPNGGYKIGDMCVPQKNECPCVNNGIVKAPGETWKPNDHEFCRCNGDTQECVPTCPESLKCKPYEKKIFTGPSEDGECCKCVPSCQYCKIGSHKYVPIGEKWSISRDENSCVEGQCLLDEDGECAILEKDQIICEKPCPKDMKRSTNGTCCDCEPTTQVSTTPSTTEASTTIESSTTKSQSTTESSTTQSQSTTEAATTPSQTTESSTTPSQTTGSSTTQSQTTTKLSTTQSQTTTKSSTTQSQTTTESPTTKSSTTRSQTTESSTTQSQSTTESPTTKSSTTQSQTTEAATTPLQTTESSTTQSQTTEASTTKSSTVESKSTTESSTTESPTTPSQTTKSLTTSSQTTESQTTESSTTKSSTMLPTTPTCDCKNLLPVGVSDGRIPDSQMKSNSVRVTSPGPFNTGPAQARLNNKLTSSGSGAWEPKDKEAHLDIIFNKMEDVREIRTQGSPRINRFAKRFFVFYSLDGENFEQEPLPSPDGSPIFEGNTDNNGIKVNKLNIKAKAIRIVPANDESIGEPKVAMRVEFYVCPPCFTTPLPPVTTPQSTTTVGKSTNIYTEPPQSTEPQVGETTTKASTTQSQSTKESSTTPSQSTKASTTQSQTTAEASTTQSQTTEASTTEDLTTKSSTTKSSTTQSQSTTEASTTPSQTTEASTTQSQTTEASTTKSQTTEASTTQSQTTAEFSTTEASTTKSKTTKSSTTSSQTTKSQTTESSTTKSSTMSPTTPTCDCKNLLPVGVSDGRIPDSQMKSNSIKVSNPGQVYTGPAEARLNNKLTSSGSGAWEPKDKEAHLDIIFNKMEDVREIRTQGSPRHNRFATRYFVFYSLNGVNFEQEPLISADGSPVFEGNTNNNGIKVNKLNIKAKAIRIVPGNDESIGEPLVAMRVEFYVCPPCSTTPAPPVTTRQSSTTQSQTTEESSTTPSQTTTESSTTQSQTTSEGSTTPSKTTTESQSTTESPTEGSTTPKPKECTVKETKIKIKHQECISKEEITVASCSGSCQSSATFSAEPPFFSQDCTCCKPTEFIDVQVPMTCMRTRPTSMIIKKIAKCICSRCDSEAVIPTQHPTQGDAINPDDISNEPVVSKARRKRSITERLYDMVFGQ